MQSKALLRDVLRSQGLDQLTNKLQRSPLRRARELTENDESDDELVQVQSLPGTPARSRTTSRASSPTRASSRRLPGPLHLSLTRVHHTDPLRAFPTEISQHIFRLLSISDLTVCSRVCRKWNKSQTLNYVWFGHVRKNTFQDNSLPTGKWTRRESKMNWRQRYKDYVLSREDEKYQSPSSANPSGSQTPREMREELWKVETEAMQRPDKHEMREMYKDLGGRKPRTKGRLPTGVGGGGHRDRGGWGDYVMEND